MRILRTVVLALGLLFPVAAMAVNPANIPVVQTIAQLKALGAAAPQYPDVNVLGYYAANDGGGGLVHWSSASTATADNAYVFQATGVATGRYFRNLGATSLSIVQCGAKPDGSTDNTTTLQACFNAMSTNNLGEIYCPGAGLSYNFSGTITPVGGGLLRGVGNSYNTGLGSTSTVPGVCSFQHTGTGVGFDFQTPFTAGACPSTVGPRYTNFDIIETSTGNSIRTNNPSTAGFNDDCAASGGGQSQVFGNNITNVVFSSSQRGTTAIECNKCFDTTYDGNYFTFYDTQIKIKGSDNQYVNNNHFKLATLRAVDITSSGTFGNFDNVTNNTFYSVFTNASDFVRSSARSGVGKNNYFETDFAGITNVLNLTCALGQTWTDNTMALLPAYVTNWVSVTGDCTQITLTNNYGLGGGSVTASWNAAAGSHWIANSTKQKIFAWGNPDDNSRVPFVTREPAPLWGNGPNTYSGSVVGTFDASSNDNLGGNYASSIYIGPAGFSGAFDFAAVTAPAGHITFKMKPAVVGKVDEYIYAATGAGSNQQIVCSDGVTTTTITLTGGTTKTWYTFSNAAGDTVNDPTIECYNNDTVHGQHAYIYQWKAIFH